MLSFFSLSCVGCARAKGRSTLTHKHAAMQTYTHTHTHTHTDTHMYHNMYLFFSGCIRTSWTTWTSSEFCRTNTHNSLEFDKVFCECSDGCFSLWCRVFLVCPLLMWVFIPPFKLSSSPVGICVWYVCRSFMCPSSVGWVVWCVCVYFSVFQAGILLFIIISEAEWPCSSAGVHRFTHST